MTHDEKAQAHGRDLAAQTTFWRVRDLAARWGVDPTTVTAIPFDALAWVQVGRGTKCVHRRYDPAVVLAFEASGGLAARGRRGRAA